MLSTDVLRLIAAARSAASTDVGTTTLRVGIGSARFFRQGRKKSRCQRLVPQSPRILCTLAEAPHVALVDGATPTPMERHARRGPLTTIANLTLVFPGSNRLGFYMQHVRRGMFSLESTSCL